MPNLLDTIQTTGSFPTFIRALEMAGLIETLKGPGPLTVFVPSEEAFAKFPQDKREKLITKGEKLSRVMQYHLVSGFYTTNDLLDRTFLKTLEGQRLFLESMISTLPVHEEIKSGTDAYGFVIEDRITATIRQSITVNGATILQADLRSDNGIMHVIDKVLVPKFLNL